MSEIAISTCNTMEVAVLVVLTAFTNNILEQQLVFLENVSPSKKTSLKNNLLKQCHELIFQCCERH